MIIYHSTKSGFQDDILSGDIEGIILDRMRIMQNRKVGKSELNSWKNSLMYMNTVLQDKDIPDDAGIGIETQIPQTSKRIDFIISGSDVSNQDHVVIIELKQWSTADITEMDG